MRYEITRDGRVFKPNGQEAKYSTHRNGHVHVNMKCEDGKWRKKKVHVLVAQEHLPNPYNLPDVYHNDADRSNNNVSNLRWVPKEPSILIS